MKAQTKKPFLALLGLLAAAALGFALRLAQLQWVFDADGLPTTGHPLSYGLAGLCVVTALAVTLFCRRLEQRSSWQAIAGQSPVRVALGSLGAILLGLSCLLGAVDGLLTLHSSTQQLLCALSICTELLGCLCALCLLVAALRQYQGKAVNPVFYLIPFLYLMIRLILDFKSWSIDPILLDYCYRLFAMLCAMGGIYRIGGFCFDAGRRRLSAFWSMLGVFFCAIALPGDVPADSCLYGGLGLWMLLCTLALLFAKEDPTPQGGA